MSPAPRNGSALPLPARWFTPALAVALLGGAAPADTAARLRTEGPAGWARLQESERTVVCRADFERYRETKDSGRVLAVAKSYDFKRRGELISLVYSRPGGRVIDAVAVGPDYAFSVERVPERDVFKLKGYDRRPARKTSDEVLNTLVVGLTLGAERKIPEATLDEMIKSSGFRLLAARDGTRDGRPVAEIEFEFRNPASGVRCTEGRLVLRPDLDWALLEASYLHNGTHRITVRNAYDESRRPGFALLSTAEETKRLGDPAGEVVTDLVRFTEFSPRVPDDSEFRLSAFGLDEPADVAPAAAESRLGVHHLLLIAGIFLLAVGVVLRHRVRPVVPGCSPLETSIV